MRRYTPLVALLLLLLSSGVHAELRTYDLQHRSAAELIPILQPLLQEEDAISGTGYTLIVRSSEKKLEEIDALLEKLDTAPQMLMISVKQESKGRDSGTGASVSGNLEQPQVRVYGTQRRDDEGIAQQLQVMEGRWATIRAGQAVPQVTQRYSHSAGGSSVEQRIEYRDVESGFEVRPRIRGERVFLEVRPFSANLSRQGGGVIEQQEIITTVSGRVGEWITLGGVAEEARGEGSGTIYSTRKRDQQTRTVRIKVEPVTH